MTKYNHLSKAVKISLDLAVLGLAFFLAYLIRFRGTLRMHHLEMCLFVLPFAVGVKYLFLGLFGVPSLAWRFVSVYEAQRIGPALLAASGAILALNASLPWLGEILPPFQNIGIPSGVIILDFLLSLLGVLGVRLVTRVTYHAWERKGRAKGLPAPVPTIMVGACSVGAAVVKEVMAHPELGVLPIAFVDDNPAHRGSLIHGTPVLGSIADLDGLIRRTGAKQILITLATPNGDTVHRVLRAGEQNRVPVKIIPGLTEIIGGKVRLSSMRDVAIEDLLRRQPVCLDMERIAEFLHGRRVLVTGAGGSIGSELCRTVCRFQPASLALVEHTENSLFYIDRELVKAFPDVPLLPFVADVTDGNRMSHIFSTCKPEIVLHAAAHKHVPLMEHNQGEAVKNNVIGTRTLANLSDRFGVSNFVMISTDKAVNPSSIMGVSKRIAEIYIQALSQQSSTRFVAVRFGNVLGSAGSVIPLFKDQIAKGGPVTVTHPDMTRYFMTIPEASQLVLQAASMGQGGEIFILDMGEPVKIVDLARALIELSGFSTEEIPIKFTGMRPGEKLFEELALRDEVAEKTRHPKIFIGRLRTYLWDRINQQIDELWKLADSADPVILLRKLKEIVPEYKYIEPAPTEPTPKGPAYTDQAMAETVKDLRCDMLHDTPVPTGAATVRQDQEEVLAGPHLSVEPSVSTGS